MKIFRKNKTCVLTTMLKSVKYNIIIIFRRLSKPQSIKHQNQMYNLNLSLSHQIYYLNLSLSHLICYLT